MMFELFTICIIMHSWKRYAQ